MFMLPVLLQFCGSKPDYKEAGLDDQWVGFTQLPVGQTVEFRYAVLDANNGYKFKHWVVDGERTQLSLQAARTWLALNVPVS